MVLPSKSRKGKKAWRRNLDDTEMVEVVQQETHQDRRGPAVGSLKDDELFFEDKAPAPAPTLASRKKREKRPTRAQLILQAPQAIKPVVPPKAPMRKPKPVLAKPAQQPVTGDPAAAGKQLALVKNGKVSEQQPGSLDLWEGSEGEGPGAAERQPKLSVPRGPSVARKGEGRAVSRIKAVEVDAAGCSYNPDFESHQEALAVLVATENKKLLLKELEKGGVPAVVDAAEVAEQIAAEQDELARLLTDAPAEDEGEEEQDKGGAAADDEDGPGGSGSASKGPKKKTKKDRARAARAAEEARAAEARKALKRQRALLHDLPKVVSEVEEEEREAAARRLRRKVVQEEKAASQPPRLGKLKYEELPVQVLTSDEVGQGLRRLKAFPMLATERFKSFQKRGLVEPRKPIGSRVNKKKVIYEKGARTEKAQAGQQSLQELRKANQKASKAVKQML